jgi:tetratricopeptide (TPR) repeat protein
MASIEYVYSGRYSEAEETARKIIEKYPAHPAGYFFTAVTLDSWMAAHFSDKKEEQFFHYCDLAVEKSEKILEKNSMDEWALFFKGGAEGYKGTYEARYQRWITAFRYGWKGVSILLKLQAAKSGLPDINVGIGSYYYWRSALIKSLWWMPNIGDKRQEGISLVQKSCDSGIYTRVSASASLVDIYINEGMYDHAFALSNESLQLHPHAQPFMFGKARSLYGMGKYAESEAAYRDILSAMGADPGGNRGGTALCRYWIAKIEFTLGRYQECLNECEMIKAVKLGDEEEKLLEKPVKEAESMKKNASAALKRKK